MTVGARRGPLSFTETGRHAETFDRYGAVEFIDMERPG
jgi:hypothetical protein